MEQINNSNDINNSEAINSPHKSKLPILTGIIIVIVVVGIIGYFLGRTSQSNTIPSNNPPPVTTIKDSSQNIQPNKTEEIRDWQSFSSESNGIRFQYPPDYSEKDRENYISLLSPLNPTPQKGYAVREDELKLEIVITESKPNDSLELWIEEEKKDTSIEVTEEARTMISGVPVAVLKVVGMGTSRLYLALHQGRRILIIKYPDITSRDAEFEQILSTIQFQ